MVETECLRWASKGLNITYQIRETRGGYKAGALKEGLKHNYVKDCEYVVIFDADFRPEPDFLRRSIPFLIHNPEIALVQGRWRFGKTLKSHIILTVCDCDVVVDDFNWHLFVDIRKCRWYY